MDNYSVADELTKLDDLRRRGIVTEAEFEEQKSKLLSSYDGFKGHRSGRNS
jgi:hypothetical protein